MKPILFFVLGSTAATVFIFYNENRKENFVPSGNLAEADPGKKKTANEYIPVADVEEIPNEETYQEFIYNSYFK